MPKAIDCLRLIFYLLTAMITFGAMSSYAATSEILILFDQTESILRYNTKLLSGLWVSNIIRMFEAPNRITLVGFDYESHEYFSVVIREEAELSSLSGTFDGIELSGLATDLEIPFRYVLGRVADDSLKMALIITDGEPDIWDENIGFLSPHVLVDERYKDLNTQYFSLKDSGLSGPELYNRMGAKYGTRNLELIEQAVSLLHGKMKMKLVIWDISGESELLKRWARQLNAIYIPLDISTAELLIDVPREFLTASRETASALLEEPEPKPDIHQSKTQKALLPEWIGDFTNILIVFAVTACIFGLLLYRRRRSSARPEIEGNDSAASMVSSESVNDSVSEPVLVPEKETVDESDLVVDRQITDTLPDKDEILNYIDRRIKSALEDTEEFISELFSEATAGLGSDKRLSLREQTPPGSIVVHWTDREGIHKSANAINISMHGILLAASHCETDSIDCIEVAGKDIRIGVTRSIIKRRDADKFVVTLLEFERKTEDRMAWIEIQTRIREEN